MDNSPAGFWPIHRVSFYFNYLFKGPVSKCSPIMSYWGDIIQFLAEGQTTFCLSMCQRMEIWLLFYVPASRAWVPVSPYPHQPLSFYIKKKKKSNQPSGYLIMALICISLMTNNVVIYSSPLPIFKLGCLFVELYKLFVFSGF